jgi:hypothetical protein
LASYTHIHALGNDLWSEAMVNNGLRFRQQRSRLQGSMISQAVSGIELQQTGKHLTI